MSRSATAAVAAWAICSPRADNRKPGSRPYKILVGLSTSPWRSRWMIVSPTGGPRGCSRRGWQRGGDDREGIVVDRGRDEPGLERRRRQIDPAGKHLVEDRPE